MKNFGRIAVTLVIAAFAGTLGFACSSENGAETIGDVALGAKRQEVTPRAGLFTCDADSDCSSIGQLCCAGYCALPSTAQGKLA